LITAPTHGTRLVAMRSVWAGTGLTTVLDVRRPARNGQLSEDSADVPAMRRPGSRAQRLVQLVAV